MPAGSFAKKLYSLYLTYLPTEKFKYALNMNVDNRGSFTDWYIQRTVDRFPSISADRESPKASTGITSSGSFSSLWQATD